jgi:hypothetical protein
MTPKEKAEELILKYLRIDNDTKEWFHKGIAKQCALVAVDEILKVAEPSTEQVQYTNGEWVQGSSP